MSARAAGAAEGGRVEGGGADGGGGVEVGRGDGVDSGQADGLGESGGGRLGRGGGVVLGERERRQDGEENGGQLHFDIDVVCWKRANRALQTNAVLA